MVLSVVLENRALRPHSRLRTSYESKDGVASIMERISGSLFLLAILIDGEVTPRVMDWNS